MMELYNIGLSDKTIESMLKQFPSINEMNETQIKEKIIILNELGCSNNQVINIIGSNPEYLIRTNNEIISLINQLLKLGFKCLNILFDSNPAILSLDAFEIDNIINKRLNNNEKIEDIVDNLDTNPYLFTEVQE